MPYLAPSNPSLSEPSLQVGHLVRAVLAGSTGSWLPKQVIFMEQSEGTPENPAFSPSRLPAFPTPIIFCTLPPSCRLFQSGKRHPVTGDRQPPTPSVMHNIARMPGLYYSILSLLLTFPFRYRLQSPVSCFGLSVLPPRRPTGFHRRRCCFPPSLHSLGPAL